MKRLLSILPLLFLFSCEQPIKKTQESTEFDFFLTEPTMFINQEQDNLIEGTYLKIESIDTIQQTAQINLPSNFYVTNENCKNWVIAWGEQRPYYDAGVENVREITAIENGKIAFGVLKRGNSYPKVGQKVCFWNQFPGGLKKTKEEAIITPEMFKGFNGNSIGFASVVFDSTRNLWLTLVNEVDTDTLQTYVASSKDLIHWQAENDSLPVLRASDFENIWWAGKTRNQNVPQTAIVYEIIKKDDFWYLFADGYDKDGQRYIGTIKTKDLIAGPFEISPNPIIKPNLDWMNRGVFYSKVEPYLDGYILFFCSERKDGLEMTGRAFSKDLIEWEVYPHPVIPEHKGWRSATSLASPNWIEIKDSTIYLLNAGMKSFAYGKNNNKLTSEFGMGVSGNVADAQIGLYKSTDGGHSFVPHPNNPIFSNNYADSLENEHMGGNIEFINWNGKKYMVYQAKTSAMGMRYAIYLREVKN